jgi:hypothetical protein
MAISDAMRYRMNTGGSAEDLYATIRDFLASSPDAAATQAAMAQYGISGEDVANATGGKSGGLLGGNIMAGASWNSLNTTLGDQLTEATGQATTNVAVGGATTADTLTQLNTYLAGGGQFDPNATVFLQTGGVDFIQGVDKGTIKDNINQIVKTLGDQGVNVVLTGSPYAASINDVVTNNFDPKVDPIFNEIAKENKNVALVGTQGEILQNKKLLVDALHTNAEGTAIYNQSVIDSLSQFKNEVPSSTPQDIAKVQTSNVVATSTPIITQAAANPVVAQSLARAIPTARGTVIEGDDIEAQIAGVPQVVYETRVDPNNTANWETFNPKTGEVIDRGTFAGGGDQGLLAASRPVLALAASVLGAPYLSNLIAGATPLTGSALAGATGATIAGGSTALTGGSAEDTLRAALLGGGGAYLGNALNNLDVPVDFNNMTQEQINDALQTNLVKDLRQAGAGSPQEFLTGQGRNAAGYIQESVAATNLANNLSTQGLNSSEIAQLLDSAGFVPTAITDALDSLSIATPVAVSTPVSDGGAVNITAPASLNNVLSTIASPASTLTITGDRQVDQQTVNAINNALITNAPETVKITDNKPLTADQVVNLLATTPVASAVTQPIPQQTIIAQRPSSITDAITAATIPLIQPTTPLEVPKVVAEKTTTVDPLRVAQLGLTAAGLLGAGSALTDTGTGTQFPIVPIPEDWRTPPKTGVAPFTPLPPINFGDRNLLIGTQWEKFLDPNYGKVPEPVKYSQPSNMSYNDLMGILGSKQGYPSSSALSINDIISGIQNQYGQVPVSTMG